MRRRIGGNYPRPIKTPKPTTIDLNGDWKTHTAQVPKGCKILGTVTHQGATGALARMADTGNFVLVRDGKISVLIGATIQRLIVAAENAPEQPEMVSIEEWEETQDS